MTLDAASHALQAWRARPRRLGRPPDRSLDELWNNLEDRSPTWTEVQAVLRTAQRASYDFAQRPSAERVCARPRACAGCGRCRACRRCRCEPCQAWRAVAAAWRVYHRTCRPESLYARSRQIVEEERWGEEDEPFVDAAPRAATMPPISAEATTRCRSPRRRLRQVQRARTLPEVIYRDDGEDSWIPSGEPSRELLHMHMIDSDEFDKWPVRSLAVQYLEVSSTPRPPCGDLELQVDGSPRLREFQAAFRAARALATPTQRAVEQLCHEITRAARWASTEQHQTREAPAQEARLRRAAEVHGPAQLVMGTHPTLTIAFDRETDGRWIASVQELPGTHVYGTSRADAMARALALIF